MCHSCTLFTVVYSSSTLYLFTVVYPSPTPYLFTVVVLPSCLVQVYFIFILGNILMGIGATPLFTVGTAFLDDISWPRKTSIYVGIYYTASVLGPALGFGLGGAMLLLYVEPNVDPARLNLQDTDPAYVGAWWLGFLLIGILVLVNSIPILMFPREIPEGELMRRQRQKDMVMEFTDHCEDKGLKGDLIEAPKHLFQIFTSPTWVLCTLALAFQAVSVVGIVSFGPKFLEVQYRVTSSVASFVGGGGGDTRSCDRHYNWFCHRLPLQIHWETSSLHCIGHFSLVHAVCRRVSVQLSECCRSWSSEQWVREAGQ